MLLNYLLIAFFIFCLLVAAVRTANNILGSIGLSRRPSRYGLRGYQEEKVFATVVPKKNLLQIWNGKRTGYPSYSVEMPVTPVNVVIDDENRILVSCEDGSTQTYDSSGNFRGSF